MPFGGKCGQAAFGGKMVVDVFGLNMVEKKLWGKRLVAFDGWMV